MRSPQPAIAYDIPYSYPSPEGADETIQPVTSRNSYLTSVAFADQNLKLMATADNRGFITLWNLPQLRACRSAAKPNPRLATDPYGNQLTLIRSADCPPETTILAQWQAASEGSAIREVALDKSGCYLASTGDDGHISLWPLTPEGKLAADSPRQDRITVANFPNQPLNSVDIHLTQGNVLLIAADTPGHRVQLYRQRVPNYGCQ